MILRHLALAPEHVAQAQEHVDRQQQVVVELERGGHNAAQASALLEQFQQSQTMHVADCEHLERELAQAEH